MPGIELIEVGNTTQAAERAAADEHGAAIGSSTAASEFGLAILAEDIEDNPTNTTRFVVIGHDAPAPSGADLTSVVFTIRKDQPGGLHRLIEPMASRGVNLTSIQLRPIKGKPWEYLFFIDLEGHRSEPQVAQALEAASAIAHSSRVLGSFPRAEAQRGPGAD